MKKKTAGTLQTEIERHYHEHSADQESFEQHTTFIAQFLLEDPGNPDPPAFDIFRVDQIYAAAGNKGKNITVTHFYAHESEAGTYLEGETLGASEDASDEGLSIGMPSIWTSPITLQQDESTAITSVKIETKLHMKILAARKSYLTKDQSAEAATARQSGRRFILGQ